MTRYRCEHRPGLACGHTHRSFRAAVICARRNHFTIVHLDGSLLTAREITRWARMAERLWPVLRARG